MRLIFTFLSFLILHNLNAQFTLGFSPGFSDPVQIQFWKHKMNLNAGATGYEGKKILGLYAAFHYINSKYHYEPTDGYRAMISYQQPVKKGRSSFGFLAHYDRILTVSNSKYYSFTASYSYYIPIDHVSNLSFGAQAGIKSVDYLSHYWFRGFPEKRFVDQVPFLNAGAFFSRKEFYAGLSAKSLLQPEMKTEYHNGSVIYNPGREFYFMAGNIFFKENKFQWNPNILLATNTSVALLQINNTVSYNNKYSLGVTYISQRISALTVNAGVNIGEKVELSFNHFLPAFGKPYNPEIKAEISARYKI